MKNDINTSKMNLVILITIHFNNISNLPYDVYKQRKLKYYTGFELAVCNLQFAKHFDSLRMSFCIFF